MTINYMFAKRSITFVSGWDKTEHTFAISGSRPQSCRTLILGKVIIGEYLCYFKVCNMEYWNISEHVKLFRTAEAKTNLYLRSGLHRPIESRPLASNDNTTKILSFVQYEHHPWLHQLLCITDHLASQISRGQASCSMHARLPSMIMEIVPNFGLAWLIDQCSTHISKQQGMPPGTWTSLASIATKSLPIGLHGSS